MSLMKQQPRRAAPCGDHKHMLSVMNACPVSNTLETTPNNKRARSNTTNLVSDGVSVPGGSCDAPPRCLFWFLGLGFPSSVHTLSLLCFYTNTNKAANLLNTGHHQHKQTTTRLTRCHAHYWTGSGVTKFFRNTYFP